MNLKQILKTIVHAVMTVVAIRSAEAQYNLPVICPTTNPDSSSAAISGSYFTDRGLFVEGNTGIIDNIDWSVSSTLGAPLTKISPNVDYYLIDHAYDISDEIDIMESTNMDVFIPLSYSTNKNGRIECNYQSSSKYKISPIVQKFTLRTDPCFIYHRFENTQNTPTYFNENGIFQQSSKKAPRSYCAKFKCSDAVPSHCNVMATFGDCNKNTSASFFKAKQKHTKNNLPQVKSSACLVL